MEGKFDNIYVYLWEEFNTVYVGRTINPRGRHYQHKHRETEETYKFSSEHHVEHPKMIIIENGLSVEEGVEREKYWINEYRENSPYNVLNKTSGGEKGNINKVFLTEEERREKKKIWYETHKIEIRIKQKEYAEKHKDEIAKYQKKYRQEHKEKIDSRLKKYQQEHKDEISKRNKKIYEENKEHHYEHGKKWINNKEKYVKYNQEHKEEKSIYNKMYREKNREKLLEKKRQYYLANKEKILLQQKEYRNSKKVDL